MPDKPRIADPASITPRIGGGYPERFNAHVGGRIKRALTDALGLTQFGVNLTELPPGAASALRHWHSHEDECVYILEGHPTLVTDAGETILHPGQAAGFPAGVADGHCLINQTDEPVVLLEIGARNDQDEGFYPDVDLHAQPGRYASENCFTRADGSPLDDED